MTVSTYRPLGIYLAAHLISFAGDDAKDVVFVVMLIFRRVSASLEGLELGSKPSPLTIMPLSKSLLNESRGILTESDLSLYLLEEGIHCL